MEFTGWNLVRCADEKIFIIYSDAVHTPELRENNGEIEAALSIDSDPCGCLGDTGIIHVHTRYSDGHNSIEDLVIACREKAIHILA